MPTNPLAEVFGFPVDDMSQEAVSHRRDRLCPYGNPSGANCTKVSATDPVGVCSIWDHGRLAITCPVRLRQGNRILSDAADFFFPGQHYVTLTEVRLKDADQKSAGNIDIVLAVLDEQRQVQDFGAIEIQSVYISGNVSEAFRSYMNDPASRWNMSWPHRQYPTPDYLSSSRKRLAPQLLFKGGILREWRKKLAVVVHEDFFARLPHLDPVEAPDADIAWLVYDLTRSKQDGRFYLKPSQVSYTKFESALRAITVPRVGDMRGFVQDIERRIRRGKFQSQPAPTSLEPTVEPLDDVWS